MEREREKKQCAVKQASSGRHTVKDKHCRHKKSGGSVEHERVLIFNGENRIFHWLHVVSRGCDKGRQTKKPNEN